MEFTDEQVQTVQEALIHILQTRLAEFERYKNSRDMLNMQRAVRLARDIKRYSKILIQIDDQLEIENWSA